MSSENSTGTVLIGGIGGGIGSSLAVLLESQGWRVAGLGRPGGSLEGFREAHPDIPIFEADAVAPSAVNAAFEQAHESLGRLDAYVHAIGSVFLKPIHLMSEEEWETVMETNLTSAFLAARAALGPMRRQKAGRLIFCSSVAARIGIGSHEAIAAAKGGVEGLVKSLAASYASLNIRVNGAAFGLVESPATAPIIASEAARQVSARMHPVGRVGRTEDAAHLLAWLLSPAADWVTGQIWTFDGGMSGLVPKPRA